MSSGTPKDAMPPELVAFLDGTHVVMAATIDEEGLPYTMVLNSAVAIDEHTVRFAIDHRTHSLKNIRANGRIMLQIIGDGFINGVRGTARVVREQMEHAPVPSALVQVDVELVKRDLPPGVEVDAPVFRWGALGPYMTNIEPQMFAELRSFSE